MRVKFHKIRGDKVKNSRHKILKRIEVIGNALPHPVYIFLILILVIMVLSALFNGYRFTISGTAEPVIVKSLLDKEGIIWLLTSSVSNFIQFPPLGMVLVTALGIGIAEETGLMKTILSTMIAKSPKMLITPIVIFVAIMGNVAGSAAFAIVPPLAAMIFKSVGKHPLAGLAAGFIGVAGGMSANLIITPTDIVNSGITEAAVKSVGSAIPVNPAINWYFMIASTFLLTLVGTIVIEKIIIPQLGKYSSVGKEDNLEEMKASLTEKKALKYAGISAVIYVILIGFTIVPFNGILRGEQGSIVPSPFLDSMIMILTGLFLIPSIVYGKKVGTIVSSMDIIRMFEKSISNFSGFILMCFFAAQFVEAFSYTNFGIVISSAGALFIKNSGFVGIPLIIVFILLVAFINFFVGILSAKWALLAPIFVPMFMQLGFSPYFTQAAFRIADSITNPISPLEAFMPFMITVAQKYDKKAGLGTIITIMFPLTVAYFIFWTLLLIIWYLLRLPLGPGAGIFC